ncbi:MAG: hypothetical protein MJ099_05540, partial [Clostridia bacterium]|nr:hypothetical protein [Clostridia bacterium]
MRRLGRSVALTVSVVLLLTAILCFASVWPIADGGSVASDGELTVDRSHASDGYVMVKGRPSEKRLKLRVKRGDNSLYYDINTGGEYEIIPLQYGSGSYSFELFKNTQGTQYAAAGPVSAE